MMLQMEVMIGSLRPHRASHKLHWIYTDVMTITMGLYITLLQLHLLPVSRPIFVKYLVSTPGVQLWQNHVEYLTLSVSPPLLLVSLL